MRRTTIQSLGGALTRSDIGRRICFDQPEAQYKKMAAIIEQFIGLVPSLPCSTKNSQEDQNNTL